jgi:hypothetical protein
MADAIYGNTELTATKQALVASVVQRELITASLLAPRVNDVSQFCVPGAKSIDFPKAANLTVTNRTEGSAGDASVVTYGVDTMLLDQNAYVAWIIDYKSQLQSNINVQLETAAKAARAHAKNVDTVIAAALETVGDATATAGAISYAIMLEMMSTYISRFGQQNMNGTWAVGVDSWAILMGLDEFKRADVYGASSIPSGVVGTALGVPVVVSPVIAANRYYLFDKDAMALGFQAGPGYSEQGANEFGSQAKRAVLDQIFGVKGMFINQAGAGAAESALVIKDGN